MHCKVDESTSQDIYRASSLEHGMFTYGYLTRSNAMRYLTYYDDDGTSLGDTRIGSLKGQNDVLFALSGLCQGIQSCDDQNFAGRFKSDISKA